MAVDERSSAVQGAEEQHRRLDASLTKFHSLLEGGHPETAGPSLQRGSCHGHGAMAIAVGFHHRHQLCSRLRADGRAGIGLDGRGDTSTQARWHGFSSDMGQGVQR